MNNPNDGSESVDAFLARIASVKGSRDEADEARRKDEEFLRSKKERAARRAERARSLSPSKTGPAPSIPLNVDLSRSNNRVINPPVDFSPTSKGLSRSNAVSSKTSPILEPSVRTSQGTVPDFAKDDSQILSKSSATTLARSGTLSWQQRPSSRDGSSVKPRPLSSFVASRNMPKEESVLTTTASDSEPTRTEIAASLGLKDPSWFRQTQDRGRKSLAYRKTQVEDSPTERPTSVSRQLPGLFPSVSPAPTHTERPSVLPDASPSPRLRPESVETARYTRGTTPDMAALRNSIAFPSPPMKDGAVADSGNKTWTPKSLGTEEEPLSLNTTEPGTPRTGPPSPTKGLGGFVQSAMMKRSDSVNKRWSVQANTGLKRGDSVAGVRPRSVIRNMHSRERSDDSRDPTTKAPTSKSRPASVYHQDEESENKDLSQGTEAPSSEVAESQVSAKSASQDRPHTPSNEAHTAVENDLLSRSPSKTMDPRRWSPTKSTWLETALSSKPEPLKPSTFKTDQPAWMVNLQRSKSVKDASPDKVPRPLSTESVEPTDFSKTPPVLGHSRTSSKVRGFDLTPSVRKGDEEGVTEIPQPPPLDTNKPVVPSKNIRPETVPAESQNPSSKIEDARARPAEVLTPVEALHQATETVEPTEVGVEDKARSTDEAVARKPPLPKPKPQTPPKTDFRAVLKSRSQTNKSSSQNEPEFKSIFGKLKPTTTANYVAPDELKTNIMTGKAALSVTGGPQKANRVDEFKDSILAKKEEMKAVANTAQKRSEPKSTPEPEVPEALARRKTLSKASAPSFRRQMTDPTKVEAPRSPSPTLSRESGFGPVKSDEKEQFAKGANKPTVAGTKPVIPSPKSASVASKPTVRDSHPPAVKTGLKVVDESSRQAVDESKSAATVGPTPVARPNTFSVSTTESNSIIPQTPQRTPAVDQKPVASIIAKQSDPTDSRVTKELAPKGDIPTEMGSEPLALPDKDTNTITSKRVPAPIQSKTESTPGRDQKTLTGKVASRMNPSLEALLLRGAGSQAAKSQESLVEKGPKAVSGSSSTTITSESPSASDLTHMTKGRAKGPKRRAPKSETVKPESTEPATMAKAPIRTTTQQIRPEAGADSKSPRRLPGKVSSPFQAQMDFSAKDGIPAVTETVLAEKRPMATVEKKEEKSSTPAFASSVPPVSNIPEMETLRVKPLVVTKSPDLRKVSGSSSAPTSRITSVAPATLSKPRVQTTSDRDTDSTDTADLQENQTGRAQPISSKPQDNPRPLTPSKKNADFSKPSTKDTDGPLKQKALAANLAKDGSSARQVSNQTAPALTTSSTSTANGQPLQTVLAAYLPHLPTEPTKAEIDTPSLLEKTVWKVDKIKTTQMTIQEVSGDGKKVVLPDQQEHILFEDCMYVVVHTFQPEQGSQTSEVYLWCGDGVAEAAIEDAQIFCRRDAREKGAKLEVIRQGKEPARFFQALGGIVITRRNKSSALYMLCGRRHLGHMAFDEVDMTPNSLCPGFTFLVSAQFGKLYLWKGKGAAADEVGCARLIGMDLGLTGEIDEIEDGEEPKTFWETLPSKTTQPWAQDWSERASSDAYPCALYRLQQEQPKSIGSFWGLRSTSPAKQSTKADVQKIEPFCQRDVEDGQVHILDTYRSIYVLPGRDAQPNASNFITACCLAQEIAMFSPAIQGRPILPTCYVVFGTLPVDLQASFRKWEATRSESNKPSACVRLEEVMEYLKI